MSQLTKAESSRINGAKSRGPVTSEGKARSAMNGVRHGLLAKSLCLNIERTEVFIEVLNDFTNRLQPIDNVELRYVEQAALAQFRFERMIGTETAMYVLQMDHQASEITKKYAKVDPPTRFAIAFKGLADDSKGTPLMVRYQNAMIRQRDSALKQLTDLRAKFPLPSEPDGPEESPQPVESKTPQPMPATNTPLRHEPAEPTPTTTNKPQNTISGSNPFAASQSEPIQAVSDPRIGKESPTC